MQVNPHLPPRVERRLVKKKGEREGGQERPRRPSFPPLPSPPPSPSPPSSVNMASAEPSASSMDVDVPAPAAAAVAPKASLIQPEDEELAAKCLAQGAYSLLVGSAASLFPYEIAREGRAARKRKRQQQQQQQQWQAGVLPNVSNCTDLFPLPPPNFHLQSSSTSTTPTFRTTSSFGRRPARTPPVRAGSTSPSLPLSSG